MRISALNQTLIIELCCCAESAHTQFSAEKFCLGYYIGFIEVLVSMLDLLSKQLLVHLHLILHLTHIRLLEDGLVTPRDLDPIKRFLPPVERHRVSMRYSTFAGVTSDTVIQVSLKLLVPF